MEETMFVLLGSGSLLFFIAIGWLYLHTNNKLSMMITPPSVSHKNQQTGFWFKDKFTPTLPDVKRYGGGSHQKQAILATEYPDEYDVHTDPLASHLPYTSRKNLFSPAEQQFLKVLEQALHPQSYRIFGKVRLAELLHTVSGLQTQQQRLAEERLHQKLLDFVVCHATTSEILGVVILEKHQSHKPDAQMHQKFIDAALASAQIPLVRIPLEQNYQVATLRKILHHSLRSLRLTNPSSLKLIPPPPTVCPKCGATLKKAKITQGQHAGKQVWACTHYPQCKTVFKMDE